MENLHRGARVFEKQRPFNAQVRLKRLGLVTSPEADAGTAKGSPPPAPVVRISAW